jgi:hypothetical protein
MNAVWKAIDKTSTGGLTHVTHTTFRPCRHHRRGPQTVTAFFVELGLKVESGRMFVEGEFLDTVIGIPDSRTEIVMLQPPEGGTRLELSSFVRPDHEPGLPAAMANELGLGRRGSSCLWPNGSADFAVGETGRCARGRVMRDGLTSRWKQGCSGFTRGPRAPMRDPAPVLGQGALHGLAPRCPVPD